MRFLAALAVLPLALAAPVLQAQQGAEAIADRWIAVLKEDADGSALQSTIASVAGILGAEPDAPFQIGSFQGFSLTGSDALVDLISNLDAVDFVEPEVQVTTQASQVNPPYGKLPCEVGLACYSMTNHPLQAWPESPIEPRVRPPTITMTRLETARTRTSSTPVSARLIRTSAAEPRSEPILLETTSTPMAVSIIVNQLLPSRRADQAIQMVTVLTSLVPLVAPLTVLQSEPI